jgi:hypothetical protein
MNGATICPMHAGPGRGDLASRADALDDAMASREDAAACGPRPLLPLGDGDGAGIVGESSGVGEARVGMFEEGMIAVPHAGQKRSSSLDVRWHAGQRGMRLSGG